jgi:hypothetical protein
VQHVQREQAATLAEHHRHERVEYRRPHLPGPEAPPAEHPVLFRRLAEKLFEHVAPRAGIVRAMLPEFMTVMSTSSLHHASFRDALLNSILLKQSIVEFKYLVNDRQEILRNF